MRAIVRMRETLFKAFLPLVLAAVLPFAVRAEKANVFFSSSTAQT